MHFKTEKAYVRGIAGGAFRGRPLVSKSIPLYDTMVVSVCGIQLCPVKAVPDSNIGLTIGILLISKDTSSFTSNTILIPK